MGAAFELLVKPLQHVGALKMFVMLSRQPVKGEGFLNVLFHPGAKFWVFLLPAQQLGGRTARKAAGILPGVGSPGTARRGGAH
jgi:hypothetical protein